jgi:hypothetical protein
MIRVLGFVTGAAGVIGAMVMLLGKPAVQEAAVVEAQQTVAATPAPIRKPAGDYDVPMPAAEPIVESQPESPVEPAPKPITAAAAEMETPDGVEPAGDATIETPADTPTETLAAKPASDALWHPFWQPFRSQIAANGFAARLTAITDIDYRVLRLKPGAYQVAFAYADEVERNAKLTQIESATGLRVAEVSP